MVESEMRTASGLRWLRYHLRLGAMMAQDGSGRRMKIGAFARTGERTLHGQRVRFNDIKELVLTAEAVGFDSFWLPDHFIFRPHEPEQLGCWEVFTFLSALASATTTIALGPLVAATSFRNPALLAKMADSLDEIAGGRFILGLGAGNWEPEHTAFGYPFDHRVGRFEEALQIIAPLLREGGGRFPRGVSRGDSVCPPPAWTVPRWRADLGRRAGRADAADHRQARGCVQRHLADHPGTGGGAAGADGRRLRGGWAGSRDTRPDRRHLRSAPGKWPTRR